MARFANDKIRQLVDYVGTPNVDRVRDSGGQYFFGMDERQWRDGQNQLLSQMQRASGNRGAQQRLKAQVMDRLGVSEKEAFAIVRDGARRGEPHTRHVNVGVPHTFQQEEIARRAMSASGNPTMFNQTDSPTGTDLVTMLGKLDQYVDVQNRYLRPGTRDKMSIGVLQGLDNNAGVRAFSEAKGTDELQDIIEKAKELSGGRYRSDKLYEERGLSDVPMERVKDYLVTSPYDVTSISNLGLRPSQGSYDPRAPMGDIETVDLNHLRDELYGMQKRDLLHPKLGGMSLMDDPNKLKLNIPMTAVRHFGSPTEQLVSPEVNEVLRQLGR